jgi:hypothetical protein
LALLNEDEMRLIEFLILSGKPVVDKDYAELTGIPRRTVAYRKNAILQKLKNFLDG